jgi:hypothetical protein
VHPGREQELDLARLLLICLGPVLVFRSHCHILCGFLCVDGSVFCIGNFHIFAPTEGATFYFFNKNHAMA